VIVLQPTRAVRTDLHGIYRGPKRLVGRTDEVASFRFGREWVLIHYRNYLTAEIADQHQVSCSQRRHFDSNYRCTRKYMYLCVPIDPKKRMRALNLGIYNAEKRE